MADGDRFCPSCGTEVDADARFCPVCGTLLADDTTPDDVLTVTQPELPPAPDWPQPEAHAEPESEAVAEAPAEVGQPAVPEAAAEAEVDAPAGPEEEPPAAEDEPESEPDANVSRAIPPARVAEPEVGQPGAPPSAGPAAPATAAPRAEPGARSPQAELPLTLPDTVSGWLVGIGSVLGAFALLPRLGEILSLLLFLALLGVAATIFLADRIPDVPHQRVLVLATLMVGLGISLERAAFTVRGLETILLLAMLTAAGGAMLLELGRDRPMPPPTSLRR